ncbi:replication-relaxation family protein [Clostridiisalibacter paucivorans]|uniref:replication-relaxation family protein n=1 Tax=Clostridiisalibacter paucivorans TaxID=408753 RepID=UPI00047C72E0|nr:replication-relaxation family protein [Clostridiisalibacter paucivorans]
MKKYKNGTRNRERVEIKGNPYLHLMNYPMNQIKEDIIYFLYDMRAATTRQIIRYTGYSGNYIRSVLRNMYENRLVHRDFPYIKKRSKPGSGEGVYFLDNQGAFFIAANKGLEKKEVNWDPRDNVVSLGAIKHTLDIAEIRVCMENSQEFKVKEFLGERRLGRISFQYEGGEIVFNPDSKIEILKKLPDGKLAKILLLLEYDRSTESLKSFAEKIQNYEKFYRSKKINEIFENIHPAVLIVSNHKTRTEKLKALVEKTKVENIKYYFTTLDENFKNNPFSFLLNEQ